MSDTLKEYNRIRQRIHRENEKQLRILYNDSSVSGISFTEFIKQYKLTRWQKLSIALSDEELKLAKISFKLSDEQLRKKIKRKTGSE